MAGAADSSGGAASAAPPFEAMKKFVRETFRASSGLVRRGVSSVPALGKPSVVRAWLLRSHRSQVLLVAGVLFLLLIAPVALRPVLRVAFPARVSNGFLGVGAKSYENPRVDPALSLLLTLGWLTLAATFALSMISEIPVAAARAQALARALELEADDVLRSQPTRSISLYRRALASTPDREHEADLRRKLEALDREISDSLGGARNVDAGVTGPPLRAPPASPALSIGAFAARRVGPGSRYHLTAELGRGGMGVVYLATDAVLERDVALKEFPARFANDPGFTERFRQEAKLLARLTHPNIVQIFDFVEDEGHLWMAMELMQGGDLDEMLRRTGALPQEAAVAIALPLAEGLGFAHSRGVVHRDFKPQNVLFTGDRIPKITDFGLAKSADASMHTVEGSILGSPRYMSPEQASGQDADLRSDLYSFGVTLFQMLTGKVPFDGDTASVLAQHITQPPPPPRALVPALSKDLEGLVLALLAKDRSRRPQSMTEVAAALSKLADAGT